MLWDFQYSSGTIRVNLSDLNFKNLRNVNVAFNLRIYLQRIKCLKKERQRDKRKIN